MKNSNSTGILVIGLIISLFIHSILFASFLVIKEKKSIKKQEEKPIYISLIKKSEKKVSLTRKVPALKKTDKKKERNKKVVKKKRIIKKISKKKIVKKKIKKKIVKRIKKVIKKKINIKKEKIEKVVSKEKDKKNPEKNIKKETDRKEDTQISNKPARKYSDKISLADLKGKSELFETGTSVIEKKKKLSEEDIYRYIKALERYLNNLARRKDLYPPMAKRLRLEGSLTVRFTIKKDGSVDEKSIKIIISSGYSILDRGAIKLIKKYVPLFAKKEGKKPPRDNLTVELPVTFEILYW